MSILTVFLPVMKFSSLESSTGYLQLARVYNEWFANPLRLMRPRAHCRMPVRRVQDDFNPNHYFAKVVEDGIA